MSSISSSIGRISDLTRSSMTSNTLLSDQASMLKVQQQISTGNALSLPSDNPAAAVGIMNLNQQIAANSQFSTNLSFASSFLATADSTLTQVSSLVTNAQSIANSSVGSTTTAAQRAAQAQVVTSLLSQLLSLANTQNQGQSVFGGANGSQNPFVSTTGGYKYVGSTQGQGTLTPSGSSLDYTVDGNSVFGGESAQVTGSQTLSPALTNTTRLADLGGATGKGVATGPVNVTVGATTFSVDLSSASNIGDVANILNAGLTAAGSNATLSTSGGSLVVNGDSSQSLTIADAANGATAADLGIAGTVAAGATSTGANLAAKVTATTPLAALNNGAGIDPTGFNITNGAATATITLAGPPALNTVGDLINAINNSGANVQAGINANGTGINVLNPVSGSGMTIGENGGTTATELGIRSFTAATQLSALNNGAGITPISQSVSGPTGTIVVTETNGTQFSFKANGISSPTQLAAAINSATGNSTVTAALNASGNGITLTDSSGGSGNLSVAGGSDFASNGSVLGIFTTGAGATLSGGNIAFSTDDFQITRKDGTSFTVNTTGAVSIQDILNKINSADGNSGANAVTASLNPNGNGILLSDASTGSGALSVTSLNASPVAQQLGILQTAPSASPGTIAGTDVNPVAPQGLFSSLIQLQNALLNNDTAGIQSAAAALANDSQRVITANGVVGAREQDISTRQSQNTSEATQLQTALGLLSSTDMTTAITQYQSLQTAYQAALQVAAQYQNLSLLNFLQ